MKETVTITRIFRGKKQTKFGEKDNVAIKTNKHGEKWLSTFKTNGTENWKDGDTVDVFIEEKNGYLNFSLDQKPGDASALEARIKKLEEHCFGKQEVPEDIPDDF